MVKIGGSSFDNCPVPLVFEDRYFILEPGAPDPLVTVVVDHAGQLYAEILRNEPGQTPVSRVTKTGAGIVTVVDNQTGDFTYKVRPASETSVVFGKITGEEVTVTIKDRLITIGTSRIENCGIDGCDAGIVVKRDGGFSMGGSLPPRIRSLFRSK